MRMIARVIKRKGFNVVVIISEYIQIANQGSFCYSDYFNITITVWQNDIHFVNAATPLAAESLLGFYIGTTTAPLLRMAI